LAAKLHRRWQRLRLSTRVLIGAIAVAGLVSSI